MTAPAFRRLTDHIARIELPYRALDLMTVPVAAWLIHTSGGFVLVDSGAPQTAQDLVRAVDEATAGEGVRAVLLTHAHYDHAGGLAELRLTWNPALICHVQEAPLLSGEQGYAQQRSFNPAFLLGRYLMDSPDWSFAPTHAVEEGQSVFDMAVIHLPGHSPGQIGFLHGSDRAFICGDAIMHLFGRWRLPSSLVTPKPSLAKRSLKRVQKLPFDHLLPSHGSPIMNTGKEMIAKLVGRAAASPAPKKK